MILNCIERSKFSNELRKIRKAEETGKGRGRGQYIFLALFYYSWGVRKFRSFYGVLIFLTRIPTILGPIRSFDPRPISRESINLSIQGKHTFSYVLSFVQSTCFYWSQFPIRKSSLSINLPYKTVSISPKVCTMYKADISLVGAPLLVPSKRPWPGVNVRNR